MKQKQHQNQTQIFEFQKNIYFLEKLIFRTFSFWIQKFLNTHHKFIKTFLLIFFILFFIIFFISFHFSDPFLVWLLTDYERPSIVFGYNNKNEIVKITEFYNQNRRIIELQKNDLNLDVVKAFIAAEDIRFMEHFGIDIPAVIRAMIINISAGRIKEGGSTITQQVARLRFLNRQRSFLRKLREASLAVLLEIKYPKHKIMEIYLNEVPLGHGTLGIDAAAQFYFQKNYKDLTLAEASVISSLTTRPNDYSPLKNPEESINKITVTFKRLVENGELTPKKAKKEYFNIIDNYIKRLNRYPSETAYTQRTDLFPYISSYLLQLLPEHIKLNLQTGGYKIYTTINVEKQTIAEEELRNWLTKLNTTRTHIQKPFTNYEIFDAKYEEYIKIIQEFFNTGNFKTKLTKNQRDFQELYLKENINELFLLSNLFFISDQDNKINNIIRAWESYIRKQMINPEIRKDYYEGAIVSINPQNGKIEALVGGSKFIPANQLLRFLSKRQPGSSIKPFVYAAGIDYFGKHPEEKQREFTAATILEDTPILYLGTDLSEYEPQNFGDEFLGMLRARDALVYSKNAATIRAYTKIGQSIVNSYLEKVLQLPANSLPKEATVALGSYEVSPLQLATAYTVFPREGSIIHPYIIEKIQDSKGKILFQTEPPKISQIYSKESMFILKNILREVVTRGTGTAANIPGYSIAGKTGTSNQYTNAWFAGFLPDNVTIVYIGIDSNKSMGKGSTGGSLAAPVYRNYIARVLKTQNYPIYKEEPVPEKIVVKEICQHSGKTPTGNCKITKEYFIINTEPTETCDIHTGDKKINIQEEWELKFDLEKDFKR